MRLEESNQRALRHRKATRRAALGPYARVDARENSRLALEDSEDDETSLDKRGGKGFWTRWLSHVPIVRSLVGDSESDESEGEDPEEIDPEETHKSSASEGDVDMDLADSTEAASGHPEEEEEEEPKEIASNGASDSMDEVREEEEEEEEEHQVEEEEKEADGGTDEDKWFKGVKTLKTSAKEDFKIAPGSIFDATKDPEQDDPMEVLPGPTPAPTPAHVSSKQQKEPSPSMNPVEEALHRKSVMELKRDLHAVGLPMKGRKEELVKRFEAYVDNHPDEKKRLLEASSDGRSHHNSKMETDKEEKSLTPVPVKRRLRTGSKSEEEEQKHEAIATDKSTQGVRQMSFGGKSSQGAKNLRIADKSVFDQAQGGDSESKQDASFSFKRISRRRQPSPSVSSPIDSPISVIQKRKTITLQEYEKLSESLRQMIDPSQLPPPQSPLSLVQNALDKSLNQPVQLCVGEAASRSKTVLYGDSFSQNYVPGSLSDRFSVSEPLPSSSSSTEQQANSVPFGKRLKRADSHEIVRHQMPMTREERRERRPRPSRLLTGSKRDEKARSAYSAAVARKVLDTLSKLKGPLEKEASDPTPSTSMSWAKHHMALMERAVSTSRGNASFSEPQDGDAPPTSTIPRVDSSASAPFGKFELKKPRTQKPMTSSFQPQQKQKTMQPVPETPVQLKPMGMGGSFLSPPTVSFTPGEALLKTQSVTKPAIIQEKKRKTGLYSFTAPEPVKLTSSGGEDYTVSYIFSAPPALREPPPQAAKRVKPTPAANSTMVKPFNFVPPSPKIQSEGAFPTIASKVSSPAESAPKPAPKTSPPPLAAPEMMSDDNPLKKFLQPAGSWRCPTCAVQNNEKLSKCPCCETDKPGASKATPALSDQPKQPGSSSNGFSSGALGVAAREKSDVASKKPSFSFGVTPTPSASDSPDKPASASPGSFSFGAPSATAASSAAEPPKPSFSFGVTPASTASESESATKPTFSFGAAPTSTTTTDSSSAKPSFSFGAAAPAPSAEKSKPEEKKAGGKRKAGDSPKESASTKLSFQLGESKDTTASQCQDTSETGSGFSFGVSSDSKQTPSVTPAFSFGAAPSTKPVADDSSAPPAKKPAFGFGAASEVKESSSEVKPAFSFGAEAKPPASFATKPVVEEKKPTFGSADQKKSEEPAKPLVTFGATPATAPEPAKPAYSFGAASPATSKPTFGSFGATSTSAEGKKDDATLSKPGFSFGTSSSPPRSAAPAESKPSFTFGSISTSSNPVPPAQPAFSFGQGQASATPASSSTSMVPAFTFGSSKPAVAQAPATAPSQPSAAFTFGGSSATSSTAAPATSTFGSSAASFGQSATPATSFGTSAAPSFGNPSSAAPAPGPNSGSTPSFSFGAGGSQSAPSTGFGAPATTTAAPSFSFGAPAAPSGPTTFGAPASATPTPAPSFGTTSGFGASSAPAFGSSGATSFGSAPGFGASSTVGGFGATPASGGFNAAPTPAPSFGAPAVGGAPGFGAPAGATDGFNMGAAPAAPKGRRILRARSSRSKR